MQRSVGNEGISALQCGNLRLVHHGARQRSIMSSLVQRQSARQAIIEFFLPLASKGIRGVNIYPYNKNNL